MIVNRESLLAQIEERLASQKESVAVEGPFFRYSVSTLYITRTNNPVLIEEVEFLICPRDQMVLADDVLEKFRTSLPLPKSNDYRPFYGGAFVYDSRRYWNPLQIGYTHFIEQIPGSAEVTQILVPTVDREVAERMKHSGVLSDRFYMDVWRNIYLYFIPNHQILSLLSAYQRKRISGKIEEIDLIKGLKNEWQENLVQELGGPNMGNAFVLFDSTLIRRVLE